MNQLYYGDNLEVLQEHIKDDSVDLVYLDPPFNSHQDYNVLFAEHDGTPSAAQIKAFQDTWHWDDAAAQTFQEVVEAGGTVARVMLAFQTFLNSSDMLAYLAMMAPRLIQLRRVLKPTGSLYLHCDPTASHYLKLLMDAVFSPARFRAEIVWKRSSAHSDTKQGSKRHGRIHDLLLFYTKGDDWTWNEVYTPYAESYVGRDYQLVEEGTGRHFRRGDLTAARPGGDTEYEWRVKKRSGIEERWVADLNDEYLSPLEGWEYTGGRPYKGRYWAYSLENMKKFAREGRLRHTFAGMPEYKRYLDEMPGVALQDIWIDITPIIAGTNERLGYPTQKPEGLLERIIQASSNEGDVILDPFCGCGTAIAVAQRLKRQWIGIDITHLAITLIKHRLQDTFRTQVRYQVTGEPTSLPDAAVLAAEDPYQFQWWALGLVGARPVERKKGADQGIDGRIFFHDEGKHGRTKQVILSVKSGHLKLSDLRDLRGVLQREAAQIGVLICLQTPTKPMRTEAASAGYYTSPWGNHPTLQLLTIADLFDGKGIDYPGWVNSTFKTAPKVSPRERENLEFPL